MKTNKDHTAQELFKAFINFRRLHWLNSYEIGLKPSSIRILFLVKAGGNSDPPGVKVSEISTRLDVASPTITQLIKELEAVGLVERKMDESDRRVVRILLTDEGEKIYQKTRSYIIKVFGGLHEFLGEEQSRQLVDLFSRVSLYFSGLSSRPDRGAAW